MLGLLCAALYLLLALAAYTSITVSPRQRIEAIKTHCRSNPKQLMRTAESVKLRT